MKNWIKALSEYETHCKDVVDIVIEIVKIKDWEKHLLFALE